MDFAVNRVDSGKADNSYELYNAGGTLLASATPEQEGATNELSQRVRFVRADSVVEATLDLPLAGLKGDTKDTQHAGYVLIVDHAVYAILNEYYLPPPSAGEPHPWYYVLEADDRRWLVWRKRTEALFALYDEVPPVLSMVDPLADIDLPEPIGRVRIWEPDTADYDFTIDLAPDLMRHSDLVALALVFLIDRQT
jgi:hypothetical protein